MRLTAVSQVSVLQSLDGPPLPSAGNRLVLAASEPPGEHSENETKKIQYFWYFHAHFGGKENIFLAMMRKPSATRLAAGSYLFTRGICWAKLANYGLYWTKLSLFLMLIGWDDLIRLLYRSSLVSLLQNIGASYLQSSESLVLFFCFFVFYSHLSKRHFSCGTNWLFSVTILWPRQTLTSQPIPPSVCGQGGHDKIGRFNRETQTLWCQSGPCWEESVGMDHRKLVLIHDYLLFSS